jgi:hypothetical protein
VRLPGHCLTTQGPFRWRCKQRWRAAFGRGRVRAFGEFYNNIGRGGAPDVGCVDAAAHVEDNRTGRALLMLSHMGFPLLRLDDMNSEVEHLSGREHPSARFERGAVMPCTALSLHNFTAYHQTDAAN